MSETSQLPPSSLQLEARVTELALVVGIVLDTLGAVASRLEVLEREVMTLALERWGA